MPRYTYTFDLMDPRGFGVTLDIGADSESDARERLLSLPEEIEIPLESHTTATLRFHQGMDEAELVSVYDQQEKKHIL